MLTVAPMRQTNNANRNTTMNRLARSAKNAPMSPDAYAGFLRLLLTPENRAPRPSGDIDAYLAYVANRDPLPDNVRRMIGQHTVEAA